MSSRCNFSSTSNERYFFNGTKRDTTPTIDNDEEMEATTGITVIDNNRKMETNLATQASANSARDIL